MQSFSLMLPSLEGASTASGRVAPGSDRSDFVLCSTIFRHGHKKLAICPHGEWPAKGRIVHGASLEKKV